MMFTRNFWGAAFERALKSAAQFAIYAWGADGVGVVTMEWSTPAVLATAAVSGAVLSILMSVASAPIGGNSESPSLVKDAPA